MESELGAIRVSRFVSQELSHLPEDHPDKAFLEALSDLVDAYIQRPRVFEMPKPSYRARAALVTVDGLKVRELRNQAQLTQAEVASAIGITRGRLGQIEGREGARMKRPFAESLANILQTPLESLRPNPQ